MRAIAVPILCALCACAGACSQAVETSVSRNAGYELTDDGVIFRYFDPDVSNVFVVGDFNNWTPNLDRMVDKNDDGHWTLFYPLEPGRYQYKFVIDGTYWIPDPKNPNTVPDGFDSGNSVLVIPQSR